MVSGRQFFHEPTAVVTQDHHDRVALRFVPVPRKRLDLDPTVLVRGWQAGPWREIFSTIDSNPVLGNPDNWWLVESPLWGKMG